MILFVQESLKQAWPPEEILNRLSLNYRTVMELESKPLKPAMHQQTLPERLVRRQCCNEDRLRLRQVALKEDQKQDCKRIFIKCQSLSLVISTHKTHSHKHIHTKKTLHQSFLFAIRRCNSFSCVLNRLLTCLLPGSKQEI